MAVCGWLLCELLATGGLPPFSMQASLGGDVPVGVHGGPLLGVSYRRATSSGAELSGEETSPVMQLWGWDGRTKVGQSRVGGSCGWWMEGG